MTNLTQKKAKGITLRLAVITSLFLISLFVFWIITDEIVLENKTAFDVFIFKKLASLNSPAVTKLMLVITFFGSNIFLLPAYMIITTYYLFLKKNTKLSLNVAAIGISSTALLFLMKNIFKRHRPPDPLIENVNGFSYPSGHSFSGFTFFGILIYIVWQTNIQEVWKYIWSGIFILFAACIALSRVYLHVHFPSDVLAGFCLSVLWLTISLWVLRAINTRYSM